MDRKRHPQLFFGNFVAARDSDHHFERSTLDADADVKSNQIKIRGER